MLRVLDFKEKNMPALSVNNTLEKDDTEFMWMVASYSQSDTSLPMKKV